MRQETLQEGSLGKAAGREPQLTDTVLMVRPAAFGFNPETAVTNAFQAETALTAAEVQAQALAEFDGFVAQLRAAGVRVVVFQDPGFPPTPDSLFPNNWVSFHPDGTAVLYPMHAPNRRAERRPALLAQVQREVGLPLAGILDLSAAEADDRFLEGTGSLVLDRAHRVAYACRSPRTDAGLAAAWAEKLGYELLLFDATDATGQPIYHTNVLMSVGENVAVVCFEAIPNPAEAAAVRQRLETTGRAVLAISRAQLAAFAGNMLQVSTAVGTPLLVLSAQAWQALDTDQRALLEAQTRVLTALLDTIERHGGGSARCMLAEVFGPGAAF